MEMFSDQEEKQDLTHHKILTISIAAYNMEQYLETCLDSLTDERIIDELEVFVIDDGSTDRTLEIAERYAERFPDSIIPVHQENGGYGTTVNYSIRHVAGKYFKTLDADDWFDRAGLYRLVKDLESAEADIIVNSYYKGSSADNLKLMKYRCSRFGSTISFSDLVRGQVLSIWAVSCRSRILKQMDLRLPGRSLYTDSIIIPKILAEARTICFYDYPVYCYRIGREHQSTSRLTQAVHADEMMEMCRDVCRFSEGQKENPAYPYILARAAGCYKNAIKALLLCPVSKENLEIGRAHV